jgi:hypothetical protein
MAGTVVRSVGWGAPYGTGRFDPFGKRATFTLSDGTAAVVVLDPNQAGVTGDGGDGTDVSKIYVYTSSDRTTWKLRATVTPTAPVMHNSDVWAACIGSNNNIHVCWRDSTGLLKYRRVDYAAGPVYTVQAEETVLAAIPTNGTTSYIQALDIDVCGSTNNAIIAAFAWLGTATTSLRRVELRVWVKNDTPAWVAQPTIPITSNGQWYYQGVQDVTIAADSAGRDGANLINACVVLPRKRNDAVDLGDVLMCFRLNVATGAAVSQTFLNPSGGIGFQGFNAGYGQGLRRYWLFSTAAGEYTLVGVASFDPLMPTVWRFTVSSSVVKTDLIGLVRFPTTGVYTKPGWWYGAVAVTYGNETAILHGIGANRYIYAQTLVFSRTPTHSVRWASSTKWDELYTFGGAYARHAVGGSGNRNFSFNRHDMLWSASFYGSVNWYKLEVFPAEQPLAPRSVVPAASSTLTTDRPILSADHAWSMTHPQERTKILWQVASDAGFSTNLRSVTESDSDYVLASSTASPNNAKVTAIEVTPSLAELFQGTWYVRARSQTELGDLGPWSAAQSFVVTHQPSASNLFPTGDVIFDYGGSGAVTFNWKFTDPSPYDFQTAYQIIIEDAVLETLVLDTGKITSALQAATHNVPIGGKDVQLRWKIRLWDSDDVQGPDSSYATFYTVDKPAVVVDYPTSATSNILSADDSGFEVTAGTWVAVANAPAPVRDTTQFRSGVASLKGTATAGGAVVLGTSTTAYRCYPGQELTEGAWSRAGSTGRACQMVYKFYDGGAAYMPGLDVLGPTAVDNNAGWTQVPTATTFAPPDSASYQVAVQRNAMVAAETFFIDDVTSGDTGNINTASPVVKWTVTVGGGRFQTNYRVVISQGSVTVYATKWQLSSASSHKIPLGYLANTQTYTVTVYVKDSLGLENSASQTFSTSWSLPAAPAVTVDTSPYQTSGYVRVTWTNATVDADFISYNVYRRLATETAWTLMDTEVVNQANYEFRDYLTSSGVDYHYAVTQVVDRFSSVVESVSNVNAVTVVSENYWLIHPNDSTKNVMLRNVTDDPHEEEYEQADYVIIGRGRHVDYGDRVGYRGTLTAKLRDVAGGLTARQQRQALVALRGEQRELFLRNPFGDVWQVALENISVGRVAGVGRAEYVDLTIPYMEVAS